MEDTQSHALQLGYLSIEADTWLIDPGDPELDDMKAEWEEGAEEWEESKDAEGAEDRNGNGLGLGLSDQDVAQRALVGGDDQKEQNPQRNQHTFSPFRHSSFKFTSPDPESPPSDPSPIRAPTLYVGHTRRNAFHPDRTLKGLYLDPIWEILEGRNAGRRHRISGMGERRSWVQSVQEGSRIEGTREGTMMEEERSWDWKGVFEDDPHKSLIFQIDMKGDGETLWPQLLEAVGPFLDAGYLTIFHSNSSTDPTSGTLFRGPLTIVGTGSTPAHLVYTQSPRCVFYDAPLQLLDEPLTLPAGKQVDWHPSFSPVASALFPTRWYYPTPRTHRADLGAISDIAHRKGIQVRWWGLAIPPGAGAWRNMLWRLLMETGSDWLNVDALEQGAVFMRKWQEEGSGEHGVDGDGGRASDHEM